MGGDYSNNLESCCNSFLYWVRTLHSSKCTMKSALMLGIEIHLDNCLPPCTVPSCKRNRIWITKESSQY
jgi:hypothetical protein